MSAVNKCFQFIHCYNMQLSFIDIAELVFAHHSPLHSCWVNLLTQLYIFIIIIRAQFTCRKRDALRPLYSARKPSFFITVIAIPVIFFFTSCWVCRCTWIVGQRESRDTAQWGIYRFSAEEWESKVANISSAIYSQRRPLLIPHKDPIFPLYNHTVLSHCDCNTDSFTVHIYVCMQCLRSSIQACTNQPSFYEQPPNTGVDPTFVWMLVYGLLAMVGWTCKAYTWCI